MRNLLSAEFLRLWKNHVFWACAAIMAAMGLYMTVELHADMARLGYVSFLDEVLLNYGVFHIVLAAVFSSVFIGTEYSGGTIRNKIIVGHRRGEIYSSMFIICSTANIMICGAYIIPSLLVGVPLLGIASTLSSVLVYLLCSFVMSMAVSSVFTMISFLSRSRTVSAVVCLLVAIVLLYAGSFISGRLNAPEEYLSYYEETEDGSILVGEMVPNLAYVRGTEREVYEFFFDLLPSGQAIQFSGLSAERLWRLPLLSFAVIAVSTGTGLVMFRCKDLK